MRGKPLRVSIIAWVCVACCLIASPTAAQKNSADGGSAAKSFDFVIRNGDVIDGTGVKRIRADVAILDGKIAAVGDLGNAAADRVIDAAGKIVAPGFIDLHSHAERGLVSDDPARRSAPNLISQGITTVVVNQDGGGPLDVAEQRRTMDRLGIGLNVVQMIGHGTIRKAAMGDDYRRPASSAEVEKMQGYLCAALNSGAFGLSAGLEYVPGRWSTPREMETLAQTVADADGVYIVHERSSGSRPMWFLPSRDPADQPSMIDNLEELIAIAANTNVRTVATHIKARGTDFWGSSKQMNEMIRQARSDGVPIFADQYPYNTSGSDGRIVLIPDWVTAHGREEADAKSGDAHADFAKPLKAVLADESLAKNLRRDIEYEITRRGGPSQILIVEHKDEALEGKSLGEYAAALKESPVEAAISLQLQGDHTYRGGARLRAFSMSEEDVEAFARTPWTATSSDAGIALPGDGPVHPRFYGAFPRKIRRYAIDRGLITIEEAVRVSTSLPASILKLSDRGVIRPGAWADLVVFDPETIRDTADAFHPHGFTEGIEYVFVNGKSAVDDGQRNGTLAGRVLTRPRAVDDAGSSRLEPQTKTKVEQIVADLMKQHGIPGLSVAAAVKDRLCYSKGFGQSDVENAVRATEETRYRTASIAKSMTAVAVLSLVEKGDIDLDTDVQRYCPRYPAKEWRVTPRLLLGHLGGVRHYKSRMEAVSTDHFSSVDAALGTFCDDPLVCEPGTKFLYSSFGYNLLGSVCEGAADCSFVELLQQSVFAPAGMSQTVVDNHFAIIPHRTRGYIRPSKAMLEKRSLGDELTEGQLYNAPLHDTSAKIPGGGLLSTAPDLVRFAVALNTGKLVRDETREQMWTSQTTRDGKETGYGFGWMIGEHSGHRVVSHTGGQSGTSTVLLLFPETGTAVAIMCNLQRTKLTDAATAIADILQNTDSADAGSDK